MGSITDRAICGKLLSPGQKVRRITDKTNKRGVGRLVLEVRASGGGELKEFYFRYRLEGNEKKYKLGVYPEVSLSAARELYSQCSEIYQAGDDPALAMRERARQALAARTTQASFEDLLDNYLAHLEGRSSYRQVKGNFKNHIKQKFHSLLRVPANQITGDDISAILREMRLQGLTVGCNRLRSQLAAAFNYCRKADNDWRTDGVTDRKFNLLINPVEAFTSPNVSVERERSRALSRRELKLYWDALDNARPVLKAFLKLHVILGGQRPEQLLRLTWDDIDGEEGHLTLINTKHDDKPHVLPLLPEAVKILTELTSWLRESGYKGKYVFPGRLGCTFTGKPLYVNSASRTFKETVDSLDFPPVELRDIRRTFKTLGASKLPVETLDRIQAHSVGSRISNRYNRFDYLDVKRQGLTVWEGFIGSLDTDDSKVVSGNILKFVI